MLVLLILFFVLGFCLAGRFERGRLQALCVTLTFGTLSVYLVTECLSVLALLMAPVLAGIWGGADLLLLVLHFHFRERKIAFSALPKREGWQRVLAPAFLVFSVFMVLLALLVVPYNWDSMTYHLTRIVCWANNRSIGHFASTITRCVGSPVLGEVMDLQIYLLSGRSDHLLNLTQCLSYLACGLLVLGITRKIGGTLRSCVLASVLFYTMPIAFAESLTTQVDEFASLFLLIFVYVILDPIQDGALPLLRDRTGRKILLLLAVSAALGYLAKPSVMIGMFAFALWLLLSCLHRKESGRTVLVWIFCTAGLALLLILPELARNLVTYHAISDPWQGKGQLVHTADPGLLFIGFLKNLFFNLPSIWWPDLNTVLIKAVYKTGLLLHVDVDSEAISESGRAFTLSSTGDYGCDSAVSPVITTAMLLCVLGVFIGWIVRLFRGQKGDGRNGTFGYSRVSVLTYLLMCVLIRWEPWIGRYLLAYLALLCPVIALEVQKILVRRGNQIAYGMAAGILLFVSLREGAAMIKTRVSMAGDMHAVDRQEAYFRDNPEAYQNMYLPLRRLLTAENCRIRSGYIPGRTPMPILFSAIFPAGDPRGYLLQDPGTMQSMRIHPLHRILSLRQMSLQSRIQWRSTAAPTPCRRG
jgi:hypothetical protein